MLPRSQQELIQSALSMIARTSMSFESGFRKQTILRSNQTSCDVDMKARASGFSILESSPIGWMHLIPVLQFYAPAFPGLGKR